MTGPVAPDHGVPSSGEISGNRASGPADAPRTTGLPHSNAVAGGPDEVPLLNIANVLTVLRIALVPVFLAALFVGDGHDTSWRLTATAIFAAAAITDRIDGQLARKYGLVTDFGKMADPIADKALIGAALVGLSMLGDLSWWVTVIIGVREVGITAVRFAVIRHGVIPAGRGGKVKTLVQTFAIGVYLCPLPSVVDPFAVALMALAVLLTVYTGLDYVVQAVRLRRGVSST